MAVYEHRCRTCDTHFEVRRPMDEANEPAVCPDGHTDTVRLLSVFASVRAVSGDGAMAGAGSTAPTGGGGCCGGGCGCG